MNANASDTGRGPDMPQRSAGGKPTPQKTNASAKRDSAMLLAILLGVAAILRRDFAQHGAWMLRGYAIGMGAGSQALILMAGEMIDGLPSELRRALLMGAA